MKKAAIITVLLVEMIALGCVGLSVVLAYNIHNAPAPLTAVETARCRVTASIVNESDGTPEDEYMKICAAQLRSHPQ